MVDDSHIFGDGQVIVELKNVSKSFITGQGHQKETIKVLDGITFSIVDKPEGEFVAILGPSGCGKSTILSLLAGLAKPDGGEVFYLGKPVEGENQHAVTVPQAYTCFPWLSVQANVEFGLKLNPETKGKAAEIAKDYLKKVGLGDRLNARPTELSGGMQQRVAIARALAVKPRLLLMDEPFGALDANIRAEMQEMLLRLWGEEKNTILFITHDINEALLLADRILVLSTKPARIIQDLTVPFARPRSLQIEYDDRFVQLSQMLFQLLKPSDTKSSGPGTATTP